MGGRTVFLHPSDEMYGADKVLLEVLACATGECEVWLPKDVSYPEARLSRELSARGVRVAFKRLPVLRRAKLNPIGLLGIALDVVAFAVALVASRPSRIYVNTTALALAVPVCRLVGVAPIVHVHEDLRGREGAVITFLLRFSATQICVSEAIAEPLRRRGLTPRVIYNGFDLPEPEIRGLPRQSDVVTILIASRWNAWKGHETLLAAMAHAQESKLRLVIAGGPPASGASVDVRAIVEQLGLADQCEFIGEVDEIERWIDNSDVVVVPSTQPDPLPTIAIEALARDRPILASRCGGLPEILSEGESGWLVAPGDVHAWSNALRELPTKLDDIQPRAARKQFDELFSRARFTSQMAAVLTSSAKESSHG